MFRGVILENKNISPLWFVRPEIKFVFGNSGHFKNVTSLSLHFRNLQIPPTRHFHIVHVAVWILISSALLQNIVTSRCSPEIIIHPTIISKPKDNSSKSTFEPWSYPSALLEKQSPLTTRRKIRWEGSKNGYLCFLKKKKEKTRMKLVGLLIRIAKVP